MSYQLKRIRQSSMLLALGLIVASLTGLALAQSSTGQLCVRGFEDRNGNGQRDNNEPPIVRGLSVTLRDEMNVIIDSGLMENSSSAASGTLCFQELAPGQYSLRVTSADYNATTPNEFIAAVSESGVPDVLTFGGEIVPLELPATTGEISQDERLRGTLIRGVFAGIGALVIMGTMAVVGVLIYFFALRNRRTRQTGVYQAVPGTGQYPSVRDTSTGQYRAVQGGGATGSTSRRMEPVNVPDTDLPREKPQGDVYNMYSDDDEASSNVPVKDRLKPPDPYSKGADASFEDDFAFDDLDAQDDDTNKPFRPPQ